MKKIPGWLIGMLAVVGVGGYVAFSQGTTIPYEKQESNATETEVVETPTWMQDADAVAAAEAVVKRKALEAESASIGEQIKQLDAERAELKAKQVELDKQIGTY